MMPPVLIENCQEFLSNHRVVQIDECGTFEIHTANRHGDMRVGSRTDPIECNVADDAVSVVPKYEVPEAAE